jgi:hypothetical protein
MLWVWTMILVFCVKATQFLMEGSGEAACIMVCLSLPHVLHILAARTRLSARLPRALRSVDACAAGRIYRVAVLCATLATGINPVPRAPEHFR